MGQDKHPKSEEEEKEEEQQQKKKKRKKRNIDRVCVNLSHHQRMHNQMLLGCMEAKTVFCAKSGFRKRQL